MRSSVTAIGAFGAAAVGVSRCGAVLADAARFFAGAAALVPADVFSLVEGAGAWSAASVLVAGRFLVAAAGTTLPAPWVFVLGFALDFTLGFELGLAAVPEVVRFLAGI